MPALLASVLILVLQAVAHAELGDSDKPVNLEADRVNIDDAKQVSVFEGNVKLTQGTLAIQADKIVIRQDGSGFQHGIAYGGPVIFKQKREGTNEFIEGYGERVEYDGKSNKIEFFTKARVKRGDDEVRGNYISYDAVSESYQVRGGGKEAATANNPQGRVRAVIQPKKPPTENAAPSLPLKPANGIANPREQ
ncbi:MAG: lipopolysaccharide transport periplasmic protein LptA [Burkholderiales bacterium]|nr:lipopolysaccharide transport periplasmic protein LptA [Burkholderiales bacterium]